MRTGFVLRPAAAAARRPLRGIGRTERGGAVAIESVLLVPAVMLMAALITAGFRITVAADAVENVAGASARAASIARTAGQAQQDAQSVANSSLATAGLQCAPSSVQVNAGGFGVPVGQPASVSVTVSCRAPLADLLVPGLGGSRLLEATSSSPLDTYRGRR